MSSEFRQCCRRCAGRSRLQTTAPSGVRCRAGAVMGEHPNAGLLILGLACLTRSTTQARGSEPTLEAAGGLYLTAGSAESALCDSGPRARIVGSICDCSTGRPRIAAMMLTRREAAGGERRQLAGTSNTCHR